MNMFTHFKILLSILFFFTLTFTVSASEKNAEQLFKQKCSLCHAIDKRKLGPAINAMNKDAKILQKVIVEGKNSMPGYGNKLTSNEIDSLVSYLVANQ